MQKKRKTRDRCPCRQRVHYLEVEASWQGSMWCPEIKSEADVPFRVANARLVTYGDLGVLVNYRHVLRAPGSPCGRCEMVQKYGMGSRKREHA